MSPCVCAHHSTYCGLPPLAWCLLALHSRHLGASQLLCKAEKHLSLSPQSVTSVCHKPSCRIMTSWLLFCAAVIIAGGDCMGGWGWGCLLASHRGGSHPPSGGHHSQQYCMAAPRLPPDSPGTPDGSLLSLPPLPPPPPPNRPPSPSCLKFFTLSLRCARHFALSCVVQSWSQGSEQQTWTLQGFFQDGKHASCP